MEKNKEAKQAALTFTKSLSPLKQLCESSGDSEFQSKMSDVYTSFKLSSGANLAEHHLNVETHEQIFLIGNYHGTTTQNTAFLLDNLVFKPSPKYSNNR